jgi:hypothetical protein
MEAHMPKPAKHNTTAILDRAAEHSERDSPYWTNWLSFSEARLHVDP